MVAQLGHQILVAQLGHLILVAQLGHLVLVAQLGHLILVAQLDSPILVDQLGHLILVAQLGHKIYYRSHLAILGERGTFAAEGLHTVWAPSDSTRKRRWDMHTVSIHSILTWVRAPPEHAYSLDPSSFYL